MKVGAHEIKGLDYWVSAFIDSVHFPLVILVPFPSISTWDLLYILINLSYVKIDYKGFRLIATSLLPLSNNTLIYGEFFF